MIVTLDCLYAKVLTTVSADLRMQKEPSSFNLFSYYKHKIISQPEVVYSWAWVDILLCLAVLSLCTKIDGSISTYWSDVGEDRATAMRLNTIKYSKAESNLFANISRNSTKKNLDAMKCQHVWVCVTSIKTQGQKRDKYKENMSRTLLGWHAVITLTIFFTSTSSERLRFNPQALWFMISV